MNEIARTEITKKANRIMLNIKSIPISHSYNLELGKIYAFTDLKYFSITIDKLEVTINISSPGDTRVLVCKAGYQEDIIYDFENEKLNLIIINSLENLYEVLLKEKTDIEADEKRTIDEVFEKMIKSRNIDFSGFEKDIEEIVTKQYI